MNKKFQASFILLLLLLGISFFLGPTICISQSQEADPSAVSKFFLAYPGKTWALVIDLPGFAMNAPQWHEDQITVYGENEKSDLIISIFMERATKEGDELICRDYYQRKLEESPIQMEDRKLSKRGEMALSEYMILKKIKQKHVNAYLSHENVWIDIHISKTEFKAGDEDLLDAILTTIKLVPKEQLQSKGKSFGELGMSFADKCLEEALILVKKKELARAQKIMKELCPYSIGELVERAEEGDIFCMALKITLFEVELDEPPEKLADLYWYAGDTAQKSGQYRIAKALLDISLDKDPKDAMTWYSIGHLYRDTGDIEASDEAFWRSIDAQSNDDDCDAYSFYWLATNCMDEGFLDKAENMFSKCLELDTGDEMRAKVSFRRGQIQMRRGQYEKAISDFEKAKSLGIDKSFVKEKIKQCKEAMSKSR